MASPQSPDPPEARAAGSWLPLAGATLLYAAASALGLLASTHRGNVSPLWPATGVGLWMVWRYGYRALPLIGLGTLAVAIPTDVGWVSRIGMSLSTAAE